MPSSVSSQKSQKIVLGQQPLIALKKYKIFIKVFQCILKSRKIFLIQNYFYNNAKKYKQDKKKTGKISIWQQIPKFKNIKLF